MLALEMCKRLEDCGVDQSPRASKMAYTPDGRLTLNGFIEYGGLATAFEETSGVDYIACHNSDELLAYIQQQWPDVELIIDCPDATRDTFEIDYRLPADEDWRIVGGATLADALAELICTLMEVI